MNINNELLKVANTLQAKDDGFAWIEVGKTYKSKSGVKITINVISFHAGLNAKDIEVHVDYYYESPDGEKIHNNGSGVDIIKMLRS